MYKIMFFDINDESKKKIKDSCVYVLRETEYSIFVITTDLGQINPFYSYKNTNGELERKEYTPEEAEQFLNENRHESVAVVGVYCGVPYSCCVRYADWSDMNDFK